MKEAIQLLKEAAELFGLEKFHTSDKNKALIKAADLQLIRITNHEEAQDTIRVLLKAV